MTKKEWKALKKEKGMKVYVLRYGGGRDHSKECIVLRHGEQRKEADDGQKERNEKI